MTDTATPDTKGLLPNMYLATLRKAAQSQATDCMRLYGQDILSLLDRIEELERLLAAEQHG